MAKKVLIPLLFFCLLLTGCHKKDRLSSNSYALTVTPPATTVVVGVTKTFTVQGQSSNGTVATDPTWSISPSSTVITPALPLFGPSISIAFSDPGLIVLTANFEDKTASAQVRVVTSTPATSPPSPGSPLIYTDAGIPSGASIFSDLSAGNKTELTAGDAPEGNKYMRLSNMTLNYFMVDLGASSLNLDDFPGGTLRFFIRLNHTVPSGTFIIEMARPDGSKVAAVHTGLNPWGGFKQNDPTVSTDWQAVTIDLSRFFGGQGLVKGPFIFRTSIAPPVTVDIDQVRWEK